MTNQPVGLLPDVEIIPCDGSPAHAVTLSALVAAAGLGQPQPADISACLAQPGQRAWLARRAGDGRDLGFISTFETHSLRASRLEIDLLGVIPEARRRGIGSALARRAVEHDRLAVTARQARALIRAGNAGSERAFERAGFRPRPTLLELLILAPPEAPAESAGDLAVRPAFPADLPLLAERWPAALPDRARAQSALRQPALGLLIAWEGARPAGYVELLVVTTLTYHGAWIETLATEDDANPRIWSALAAGAAHWAQERRLELLGALLDRARQGGRQTLADMRFHAVGDYRSFVLD